MVLYMAHDPSLPNLTEREEDAFNDYVRHFRRNVAPRMESSSFVMSVLPSRRGGIDVKFCTELGYAIMLGKPIIAVAVQGAPVPRALRKLVTDTIVCDGDPDTSEGQAELALKTAAALKRLGLA